MQALEDTPVLEQVPVWTLVLAPVWGEVLMATPLRGQVLSVLARFVTIKRSLWFAPLVFCPVQIFYTKVPSQGAGSPELLVARGANTHPGARLPRRRSPGVVKPVGTSCKFSLVTGLIQGISASLGGGF